MQIAQQFADFSQRLQHGSELLRSVKDRDVQIGTTPKTEVFRQDKTTLYHYEPMVKRTVPTPVLVVYGLVGRYTMADLQEDRSLVRNLLVQGVDLYAVDWGHPTRGDRWLTIDDYVDGYLDECVEFICRKEGVDSINVLGICEGGVFTLCHAALHPDRVKNLIVTVVSQHDDGESCAVRVGKNDSFIGHGVRSASSRSALSRRHRRNRSGQTPSVG